MNTREEGDKGCSARRRIGHLANMPAGRRAVPPVPSRCFAFTLPSCTSSMCSTRHYPLFILVATIDDLTRTFPPGGELVRPRPRWLPNCLRAMATLPALLPAVYSFHKGNGCKFEICCDAVVACLVERGCGCQLQAAFQLQATFSNFCCPAFRVYPKAGDPLVILHTIPGSSMPSLSDKRWRSCECTFSDSNP